MISGETIKSVKPLRAPEGVPPTNEALTLLIFVNNSLEDAAAALDLFGLEAAMSSESF